MPLFFKNLFVFNEVRFLSEFFSFPVNLEYRNWKS